MSAPARSLLGEGEGPVPAPALGVLAVGPVGRAGDDVAHAPALPVHDGVVVPHRLHLLQGPTLLKRRSIGVAPFPPLQFGGGCKETEKKPEIKHLEFRSF